jgi:hypothetical protein
MPRISVNSKEKTAACIGCNPDCLLEKTGERLEKNGKANTVLLQSFRKTEQFCNHEKAFSTAKRIKGTLFKILRQND